jgi:hypothetical protein
MFSINTTPTESLNASRVDISINSGVEFGMQFSLACYAKVTVEGEETWSSSPIFSSLLNVTGSTWDSWGSDVSDQEYIGNLALSQLGLTRAPEEAPEAPEAPAEEAEETPAEE